MVMVGGIQANPKKVITVLINVRKKNLKAN